MSKLINKLIKKLTNYIYKMKKPRCIRKFHTADLSRDFHPEILFLVNRPYAEYVEFKEV